MINLKHYEVTLSWIVDATDEADAKAQFVNSVACNPANVMSDCEAEEVEVEEVERAA